MALRPKSSGARSRSKAMRTQTGGKRPVHARSTALKATTDHQDIRDWADARGGRPVVIRGARERAGGLRIDWSGRGHEGVEQVSWQDWFRRFDEQGMSLVFRERTGSGDLSRFCKLMPHAAVAAQTRTGRNKPKLRTAGG